MTSASLGTATPLPMAAMVEPSIRIVPAAISGPSIGKIWAFVIANIATQHLDEIWPASGRASGLTGTPGAAQAKCGLWQFRQDALELIERECAEGFRARVAELAERE